MITIQIPTYEHIPYILQLNQQYLVTHLTPEQQQGGFVRITYTSDELKLIIDAKEIVIAHLDERVIGYLLIGKKGNKPELDYHLKKSKELEDIYNLNNDKIGYGIQICVLEEFRSFTIFKELYGLLFSNVKLKYELLLGSINIANTKSQIIHARIGWILFCTENGTTNFYVFKL